MGYDRTSRGVPPQRDHGRDRGSAQHGRDENYGGGYGGGQDDHASSDRDDAPYGYGARDYGNQHYDQRDRFNRDREGYGARAGYGAQAGRGDRETYGGGRDYYGGDVRYGDRGRYARDDDRGGYASDPRRFGREDDRQRGYGRQPQGYSYEDRGFLARAGDEVRSWFGDDDAERRRDQDARMDERYAGDRDSDYHSWRRGQIDALDRDYHEYRQENRSRFESEFATWRTARQGQRDQLGKVKEHQEVVGSDGAHVGTVDKVRGDRILLTKTDADAGGRHHSIPSRWIDAVADKVTLSKSAAEAKQAWTDEENRQAMSGWGDRPDGDRDRGRTNLDRSFSGTY